MITALNSNFRIKVDPKPTVLELGSGLVVALFLWQQDWWLGVVIAFAKHSLLG